MNPAKLQLLLQNALAHHRAGRLADADALYRQARAVAPKHFDVLHLSGLLAYQQARLDDAVDRLGRAHRLQPRHAVCEMRFALALLAAKRTADAEAHLRHSLAVQPDLPEAWDNLAYCLKIQDRLPEAIACHEKLVALKPDHAPGWYNFGLTLSLAGRVADALPCHERALALDPSYATARFGRAQALQQLHRLPEAVAEYRTFLAAQPGHHEARSSLLFALQNMALPREELLAEHLAYGRAAGAAVARDFPNAPEPERRLRVAILSPDLRAHSCAYFIEPLLAHLDRAAFEVWLYHDHFREDAVTARLKPLADGWRNFVGQPGPAVEAAILADAPDILIDLTGHAGLNRLSLFARRLAPVQVTYLGYPDTTGVAAMDYRFTDAHADPEGEADRFATEKLVRFAPTAWAYAPPSDAPDVAPAPCLARGHITFGGYNNLAKITDDMLALWGRVLQAVPGARLRLKGRGLGDAPVRARYEERCARLGVPVARIDWLERTAETKQHLALYHDVDIALDTFPYHGTTTTCEALWMGVPVVSLVGDRHVSRVGASLLAAAGHGEWAANDEDGYVRAACALAGDAARLAAIRAGLRDDLRRGPLLDHAAQAERFGAALRACWADWCAMSESRTLALAAAE